MLDAKNQEIHINDNVVFIEKAYYTGGHAETWTLNTGVVKKLTAARVHIEAEILHKGVCVITKPAHQVFVLPPTQK